MRLVFHWMAKVSFCGDVRLYMKGLGLLCEVTVATDIL